MPFNEQLPQWDAPGVEPPASKKSTGWQAGEKPPADYWNWQMHRTYKALEELQQKAAEKEDVATIADLNAHTAATTGVHGATSTATPNTLVQRDSAGRFKAAEPAASDDVARKAEVDDAIEYALPKQARVLILNPGEYSDLDLSQYDAVRVLTSSGDVIINNILNNMPGHRCRLVKVNSAGSLILKAGGNANWWQGGQDIVIGPDDRYGFVDLQWLENGTIYANAVIDNGQKYARLGKDITASRLRLTVTSDVSPTSTDHAFQIGGDQGNLAMDTNEIMARDGQGGVTSLHINNEGGTVTINNTAPEGGFRFESGRFYIKNVQFIVGSGNPNGNVAAPPGSIYLNTAGGAGTTLYYKSSGTGNTGWQAVA